MNVNQKAKDFAQSADLAQIAAEVVNEILRAKRKHPRDYNSTHEAFGVLWEEVDEALDELRADDKQKFRTELIQIAAVCIRACYDLKLPKEVKQ